MNNTISVELDSQPIELCKLLKVANLVGGGGEAKIVISEGYVTVNEQVEYQKRKKIYHQDVITFNGDIIEVTCHSPVQTKPVKQKLTQQQSTKQTKAKMPKAKTPKNKAAKTKQTEHSPMNTEIGKRKKISF